MAKKMQFKSLKEVAAAFADGRLAGYKLILDNDSSWLSWEGPLPEGMKRASAAADAWLDEKNDAASAMFRGNGYADLADACEAAGIPCEWC
jgi:hypothetical protein